MILNFIRGFCMAVADSVPGVSGGTIAFIMGFYDRFINSINDLFNGKKEERKEAIIFLLKIGLGWIIGITLSILFIATVFEEHIYLISSLFLGLIVISIPLIIKEEQQAIKGNLRYIVFTFIGIIIVFLITYLNPITGNSSNTTLDLTNPNIWIMLFVYLAGMISISAMVLPGISGSTILLIMGLYTGILTAIKQVIIFDYSYIGVVIVFGIGIITGAFVTIKGVKHVLHHYRPQTIYTIIGLMIGSLYAVVMGPRSLEIPKEALSLSTFHLFFFIIGGLIIIVLDQIKIYFEKRKETINYK